MLGEQSTVQCGWNLYMWQQYNKCGTCGSQRERHRHSYPQDPTTMLICHPVMLIFTPNVSVQAHRASVVGDLIFLPESASENTVRVHSE